MTDFQSIDPADLHPRDTYRLLTSVVVPRPIAWVSTLGADGVRNLAPFSFFNAFGGHPPSVGFAVGRRADQPKDTLRNVQEIGEFVLHIVDETLAAHMNQTSGEWDYAVDEFTVAGLATLPATRVRPPRLAAAPVALEGRVTQIVPIQDTHYTLILGQVIYFHLRADLLRPDGVVDAERLRPVARLGGDGYTTLGRVFHMARPQVTR